MELLHTGEGLEEAEKLMRQELQKTGEITHRVADGQGGESVVYSARPMIDVS